MKQEESERERARDRKKGKAHYHQYPLEKKMFSFKEIEKCAE